MVEATFERKTDTAPCIGCGLCCDGTIYWRADAEPGEEERLRGAGLTVLSEGERSWFVHPCRFSSGGLCTIYDRERFAVCSKFRCKLLTAYQAGEIGLDEARATIGEAFALRSAVAAEEPSAALWKERQQLRRDLQSARQRPKLHLKIAALDYYLDRWFRTEPADPK